MVEEARRLSSRPPPDFEPAFADDAFSRGNVDDVFEAFHHELQLELGLGPLMVTQRASQKCFQGSFLAVVEILQQCREVGPWGGTAPPLQFRHSTPHNETGSRQHEHEAMFPTWYKGNQTPEVSGDESRAEKPDCLLWGLSTS